MSLHPGVVNTGICRHVPCLSSLCCCCLACCTRTPSQGASTTVFCACADDVANHGGAYYNDTKVEPLSTALANDSKKAFDLYELSIAFCADFLKDSGADLPSSRDAEEKKAD